MTENELILKIKKLKEIQPDNNWVVLTKDHILNSEQPKMVSASFWQVFSGFVFNKYKSALVSLLVVGVLFGGVFVWAQNSLPGDILYSFKRISEKSRAVFISENDKPKSDFQLTNKRLEELTEIAQTNQVKKLAPAIEEVQASMRQTAKSLRKASTMNSAQKKEIVVQIRKLEQNKQKIKSLGIMVGSDPGLDISSSQLVVEALIEDLKSRTLTDIQGDLLEKAKQDFKAGNYGEALVKILELSQ